jgi:hypothetical protein
MRTASDTLDHTCSRRNSTQCSLHSAYRLLLLMFTALY